MDVSKTVLAQIMDFVSRYEFEKCVEKYNGNYNIKSFYLLGKIYCDVFHTVDLQEKSKGYRGLPEVNFIQTLSLWYKNKIA